MTWNGWIWTIFEGFLDCAFGGSRLGMGRVATWIMVVGIITLFATTCFQVFVRSCLWSTKYSQISSLILVSNGMMNTYNAHWSNINFSFLKLILIMSIVTCIWTQVEHFLLWEIFNWSSTTLNPIGLVWTWSGGICTNPSSMFKKSIMPFECLCLTSVTLYLWDQLINFHCFV
jgi:hypothetical protein